MQEAVPHNSLIIKYEHIIIRNINIGLRFLFPNFREMLVGGISGSGGYLPNEAKKVIYGAKLPELALC